MTKMWPSYLMRFENDKDVPAMIDAWRFSRKVEKMDSLIYKTVGGGG